MQRMSAAAAEEVDRYKSYIQEQTAQIETLRGQCLELSAQNESISELLQQSNSAHAALLSVSAGEANEVASGGLSPLRAPEQGHRLEQRKQGHTETSGADKTLALSALTPGSTSHASSVPRISLGVAPSRRQADVDSVDAEGGSASLDIGRVAQRNRRDTSKEDSERRRQRARASTLASSLPLFSRHASGSLTHLANGELSTTTHHDRDARINQEGRDVEVGKERSREKRREQGHEPESDAELWQVFLDAHGTTLLYCLCLRPCLCPRLCLSVSVSACVSVRLRSLRTFVSDAEGCIQSTKSVHPCVLVCAVIGYGPCS